MSSYNTLLKNIESAEKDMMSSSGFDIMSQLLPDDEIVKNLIQLENPKMSKEDVDMMVDGFSSSDEEVDTGENDKKSNKKNKKKSKSEEEIDNLDKEGDTPFKRKKIKDTVKDEKSKQTESPLPKDSPYYNRAKEIKNIIIEKITQFLRKVKELIQEVALAAVGLVQVIPGAALLLAPFGFNVPGMISLIINMILTLLQLKSKCADVKSIFPAFKNINLVLTKTGLETTSTVLNTLYKTLDTVVCSFALGVDSFVSSALSFLKSNNSPEKEQKRVRSITRKLRKLKYLPGNNFSKVEEDDIDEVETILEEWEVFNRTSRIRAVRKKKEKQDQLNIAFSELDKLQSINNDLKDLTSIKSNTNTNNNQQNIVYDVELPNGQKLFGLSLDAVEGLKSTYNVIYSSNVKYFNIDLPNKTNLKRS
jgi:hypothetical protein